MMKLSLWGSLLVLFVALGSAGAEDPAVAKKKTPVKPDHRGRETLVRGGHNVGLPAPCIEFFRAKFPAMNAPSQNDPQSPLSKLLSFSSLGRREKRRIHAELKVVRDAIQAPVSPANGISARGRAAILYQGMPEECREEFADWLAEYVDKGEEVLGGVFSKPSKNPADQHAANINTTLVGLLWMDLRAGSPESQKALAETQAVNPGPLKRYARDVRDRYFNKRARTADGKAVEGFQFRHTVVTPGALNAAPPSWFANVRVPGLVPEGSVDFARAGSLVYTAADGREFVLNGDAKEFYAKHHATMPYAELKKGTLRAGGYRVPEAKIIVDPPAATIDRIESIPEDEASEK